MLNRVCLPKTSPAPSLSSPSLGCTPPPNTLAFGGGGGQGRIRMAVHRRRGGGYPPPPPLPMFGTDSQNFASAPSAPRGSKLQNFRPAFGGDHRALAGGGSWPTPPPFRPPPSPPSNSSLGGGLRAAFGGASPGSSRGGQWSPFLVAAGCRCGSAGRLPRPLPTPSVPPLCPPSPVAIELGAPGHTGC